MNAGGKQCLEDSQDTAQRTGIVKLVRNAVEFPEQLPKAKNLTLCQTNIPRYFYYLVNGLKQMAGREERAFEVFIENLWKILLALSFTPDSSI